MASAVVTPDPEIEATMVQAPTATGPSPPRIQPRIAVAMPKTGSDLRRSFFNPSIIFCATSVIAA
ncbi:hypothetical protein [Pararhodobacter aggregans]|uniref:hypothetical protein n=1 Tax=Pararhodobacter aggregans TaxID=404875 RepID=UPI000D4A1DE5|nr:hypothetical protein [Pararhodobacter aggregans]PTX04086.1 hypothetical protein C8N33_102363 [Pararhodobacter aggregans]